MNNCCKINLDLFFADHDNKKVSQEFLQAYEMLAAMPENTAENSIEKFTAELESRLTLIQPILRNKTEVFLGYCQEDITKLSDFFAHKFRKFGMEAVEVQKILRKIWLATPCEDKRLNYDLYNCVNYAFELIVGPAKEKISFSEIPAPVDNKWETLKKDWEARRAHYAACLDIDIDYLDTEAVDGTIFPSSSGLFAYPANPEDNECCVLEFLNFWMPHLLDCPFGQDLSPRKYKGEYRPKDVSGEFSNREELIYLRHVEYVCEKLQRIQNVPWIKPYRQFFLTMWDSFLVWEFVDKEMVSHKLEWTLSNIIPELDTLEKIDIQKETDESKFVEKISAFFGKSKEIFCEYLKGYYKGLQPTQFWLEPAREAGEGPQPVQDDGTPRIWETKNDNALYDDRYNPGDEEIYVNLWHQFPNFINTCDEYIVKDACIHKSNGLEFYEKIKKVYFLLDIPTSSRLLKYFRAFEAMLISAPAASDITALEEYYDNCYLKYHALPNPFSENMEKENSWWSTVRDIIRRREQEFEEALLQYAQSVANEDLNPANKQEILFAIKERFSKCSGIFSLELSKVEDKIEGVRQDYNFKMSAFVSRIEYIHQRDKFEREQEKLKLRMKEAETRADEQREIFSFINHSIKNTGSAVVDALALAQRDLHSQDEEFLRLWRCAYNGSVIINQMAIAVSMSYREEQINWHQDLLPENAITPWQAIVRSALSFSIPLMFIRDFSLYASVSERYFPDKETFVKAEKDWFYAANPQERDFWIKEHIGKLELFFDDSCYELKVGNKYCTTTHFFILLNELFVNAIKAASRVENAQRQFFFGFRKIDDSLHIDIKNSATSGIEEKKGLGQLVISNYIKMFHIQNYRHSFESGVCYQHLEIPLK